MQDRIRLATAGENIRIWDYASMTVVEEFSPHNSSDGVSSVCWNTNNNFLASASASGDKIVISSCKSKSVQLFTLAEGLKQTCLHLRSNSQYLVSGGHDNTVNIWELKSRRLHRSLKDHKDEVTCVRFNGNDSYIASGSTSGEIILHSFANNLSSAPFVHGDTQPVRHLKYSVLNKSLLGSVSDSGTVTLWDVNSQTSYHVFNNVHKAPATEICFSPLNDLLLASIGLDQKIIFYDTASKKTLRILETNSPLTAADITPDGVALTVGNSRGQVIQYDLRMLSTPVRTVDAHKRPVRCIQFEHSSNRSLKSGRLVSSAVNKRNSSKGNSDPGEIQSSNGIKELNTRTSSGSLTRRLPTNLSKGTAAKQDQAVTGVHLSTLLDVMSSKETDFSNVDLKILDTSGRSSLGGLFSPLRDDIAALKPNEDLSVKDVTGVHLSTFFDVMSSKKRDFSNVDFKNQDTSGRSSLGDLFSPLRDDIAALKPNEDLSVKDDIAALKPNEDLSVKDELEYLSQYLSQFTKLSSTRRNSVGDNAQQTISAPPCLFIGTEMREDAKNAESKSKSGSHNITSDAIDNFKQRKKLCSSKSDIAIRTPLASSVNISTDISERTGKEVPTQLIYVNPSNGISITSPTSTSDAVKVANSLSEKIVGSIESDRSGAPLTAVQINFIKSMIQETVDDVREACHRDIVNLQVEIIKQFHMQLNEINTLLERYSVNEGLVSEIEKLREENKRLRTHF